MWYVIICPQGRKTAMDEKTPAATQSHETGVGTSPSAQTSRETPKAPKLEEIRRKAADYLETVSAGKKLDPEDKNRIITHTLENFDDYFNRGFLHYRKSVAEAEDFALEAARILGGHGGGGGRIAGGTDVHIDHAVAAEDDA